MSQKKVELTREHFRAIIYYDFRRKLSRQEYIDQLISTFGDEAPSYTTVGNCAHGACHAIENHC